MIRKPVLAIDPEYFHCFRSVVSGRRTARGALLEVDREFHELLRIDVIRPDVMRLKISRNREFDEHPTHAVCADLEAEHPSFEVEERAEEIIVRTDRMTLRVGHDPFKLEATRSDGSLIFQTKVDADGTSWAYATLNNELLTIRNCRREDGIFGLGEKSGRFNRKGRDFLFWNTDVLNDAESAAFAKLYPPDDPRSDNTSTEFDPYYVSIPFFYHMPKAEEAAARASYDEEPPSREHQDRGGTSFSMGGFFFDNSYRGHFDFSQPLDYRIHFAGGQYTEYIFAGPSMREILSAFTWLTGRMQPPPLWALGHHQCRWFSYTQDAVLRLAAQYRRRRLPCDTLWLDIDYMDGYRVFTWNRERFPDPAELLAELRARSFRAVTIIDPGVKHEYGYPVFDEALEQDLLCRTDSGAIYVGQVWPGRTAFPDFSLNETRRWWGRLNAEHVKSGLAGIWNFGISGQPFVGADIGGFMGESSAELLVRWFQLGALTPFFRNHNSANQSDQYPWVYGEAVNAICREALELRYRLLPYIYSQFMLASASGLPVQRPLVLDFQNDRHVRDIDDEYLFGEGLLVAPVFEVGATARQVYLPAGTWYDWYTGEPHAGRRWMIAPTPMERIPLYGRGGAVIPVWPDPPQSTMGYQPELIELHVFVPGEDGRHVSTLHEDDGLTYAFERGACRRTQFVLEKSDTSLRVEAQVAGDGFPECRRERFRVIFHGAAQTSLLLNGDTVAITDHQLEIRNAGEPFRIEMELPRRTTASSPPEPS